MGFEAKYFDELTTKELYEILKARAEIFVVEQNCVYQDLDDTDCRSLHIFYEEEGTEFSFPVDLPDPGIEPRSPTLLADSLPGEPPGKCAK